MQSERTILQDSDLVKKILIGGLLALTGIGYIPLTGWMLETIRRFVRQDEELLPEWDDFGKYIMDGLKILVWGIVWSLPAILLVICLSTILLVAPSQMASSRDAEALIAVLSVAASIIAMIYAIPVSFLTAPAMGILAETDSLAEAINPSSVIQVFRSNPGGFITSALVGVLALVGLGIVGTVLCLVGIYPATAFGYAFLGQLYGNAYRQAKEN